MILCKNRDRVLYHFTPSSVEKREILSLNFFRQINYLVISLVKPLLSRNFCEKSVRESLQFLHGGDRSNSIFRRIKSLVTSFETR